MTHLEKLYEDLQAARTMENIYRNRAQEELDLAAYYGRVPEDTQKQQGRKDAIQNAARYTELADEARREADTIDAQITEAEQDQIKLLSSTTEIELEVHKTYAYPLFTEAEALEDQIGKIIIREGAVFGWYLDVIMQGRPVEAEDYYEWFHGEADVSSFDGIVEYCAQEGYLPRRPDEKWTINRLDDATRAALDTGADRALYEEAMNCGIWGAAVLEVGYGDIEVNICENEEQGRPFGITADLFVCSKGVLQDGDEDWTSEEYLDTDLGIAWTDGAWEFALRYQMYEELIRYADHRKWNLSHPIWTQKAEPRKPVKPNQYLAAITADYGPEDGVQTTYQIMTAAEIFRRIDMYDCIDEELDLYLLKGTSTIPCTWHGAWHDMSDPLRFEIIDNTTGEVLDTGYGTDH